MKYIKRLCIKNQHQLIHSMNKTCEIHLKPDNWKGNSNSGNTNLYKIKTFEKDRNNKNSAVKFIDNLQK